MPNKETTNKILFSTTLVISNSKKLNNISENVYIDTLREKSNISSPNLFRELLANFEISSIPYMERIEIQSNNPI